MSRSVFYLLNQTMGGLSWEAQERRVLLLLGVTSWEGVVVEESTVEAGEVVSLDAILGMEHETVGDGKPLEGSRWGHLRKLPLAGTQEWHREQGAWLAEGELK